MLKDTVENSPHWQLAQINIARLVAPEGDPLVQEFFDALDRINELAELSPGFVWRLQSDSASAAGTAPIIDERLIVNLSVWADVQSLFAFVYRSEHARFIARRREWFERYEGKYHVLWWIPAGSLPSVSDGLSRLWHLEHFGPAPQAFTFKRQFCPELVQ